MGKFDSLLSAMRTTDSGTGAVDSVNGATGVVVLDQDDIGDGTTYKQYSATEKTKLSGIASGAEVNVNADWNSITGDSEILNKPTIPTQYTDELAQDAVGNVVGNGLDYDDTTGAISVDETELTHNSLGSKQGGTAGEYYHLTSAQHTVVGNTSGTNTGDNATNTQYSGLVTNATHTGDVTGSGALTIATGAVTLAKMADMATGSLIYRKTALTGVPEVNTLATLKTDLGLTGTNSGDQTNISGNAATVTTNANLTGPITSVGNATSIASQTGTGTKFVVDTSPTLVTPALGVASATSLATTGNIAIGTALTTAKVEILESDVSGFKTVFKLAATNGGFFSVLNNSASNSVFLPSFGFNSIGINGRAGNFIGYIPVVNDVQNSTFGIMNFSARLADETTPLNALTFAFQNYTTTVMCIDPAGDVGIGSTAPSEKLHVVGNGYFTGTMGIGTAPTTTADLRINSTSVNESSLYVGLWQSTTYNPVGTPVAGTNVRGLLFQVSSAATADNLSNVILYGALGQVTHAGSGALGQAIGMNPGIFLSGSGNVTTSAGVTVSATASGGGSHTTFYGVRSGGITLSGGSTMGSSYAFYADAVTGATTNNYAFYSNAGLVHFGDNVDLTSGKTLTMPVGSIITDTTTGLKIGTATTQKVGFYNVTPVVQASAYTQTYSTASKTVPNATASNPPAGGTGATAGAYDTAANRNAMITSLTNNIADVLALKKVVNALIDDLQAIGIIS